MALSMDEQRILAEIERRLSADDPGLATSLSTFRRPGPGTVFRSPRARIIGSLLTVLLVALVSLMVYAMIPFRAHTVRNNVPPTAEAPSTTAISAASTHPPVSVKAAVTTSASGSTRTVASAPNQSAGHSPGPAAARTRSARAKPTGASGSPAGATGSPAGTSAASAVQP